MTYTIGIRKEDKNIWERRTPLSPQHVKKLMDCYHINSIIQPSQIRAFSNKEYSDAGALVQNNLSLCPIIFAVKEIPIDFIEPEKTYMCFSHTIKGQQHNMPMLKKLLEMGCTLIDYEKIVNSQGRRVVFFGRFAGIAGMVDTLWAFGQRLQWENINTPFSNINQTIRYKNINEIKEKIRSIRKKIETNGLPTDLIPLICGFAGYGNVSNGAQEIFDLLPIKTINPEEIPSIYDNPSNRHLYKVVFREKDMVEPIRSGKQFDLQEYYSYPERYHSVFDQYIPHLSILMNCIYWNTQYPRLVTKAFLKRFFHRKERFRLRVIGDISCDVNGAIECTVKTTDPDNPIYLYNPVTDSILDGYKGEGLIILAIDNLPCELPKESSVSFSESLWQFIPDIVKTDFSVDFNNCTLPPAIKNAVITYKGTLTPQFSYINNYL